MAMSAKRESSKKNQQHFHGQLMHGNIIQLHIQNVKKSLKKPIINILYNLNFVHIWD